MVADDVTFAAEGAEEITILAKVVGSSRLESFLLNPLRTIVSTWTKRGIQMKNVVLRSVKETGILFALFLLPNAAQGAFLTSDQFTQVISVPGDFQNSTILSVTTNSLGETVASKGRSVSTVPFDGSPSTSEPLSFTSNRIVVEGMRFSPDDSLNLLMLNFGGPGSVLRERSGSFTQFVEFGSTQGVSRALAFDSSGNLLVSGTFGSIDNPGWIRGYDAFGTAEFDVGTDQSPVAVDFNASDQAFAAMFSGDVFSVSQTGNLEFILGLTADWVGPGIGYVESFAIDPNNNFFVGVNLGQRSGQNSSAILRLASTGEISPFAFGIGDIPIDMEFTPNGDLMVASYSVAGSRIFRFSGDFSMLDLGISDQPITVPEPSTLTLFAIGLAGLSLTAGRRTTHCPPPTHLNNGIRRRFLGVAASVFDVSTDFRFGSRLCGNALI